MEGLKGLRLRAAALAGGLVLIGAAFALLPRVPQVERTEAWIASKLPTRVEGFSYVASSTDPTCSYKMDKSTYETLRPWGIVARVFDNGEEKYDVVVIGSREKESFHDPRQCFSAQSWVLSGERHSTVSTRTRGEVPVTLVEMTSDTHGKTFAMYFYRLQNKGFIGRNRDVKVEMLKNQLLSVKSLEGAFYRIIPSYPNPTEEKLKAFAAKFLDAANESSQGHY